MPDGDPVRDQVIANEPAMASPEKPLGAHDRCPLFSGDLQQLLYPVPEFGREHVVGVVTKHRVLKSQIRGRSILSLLVPAASQGFEPVVLHARLAIERVRRMADGEGGQ
jgi:hypothetical protein